MLLFVCLEHIDMHMNKKVYHIVLIRCRQGVDKAFILNRKVSGSNPTTRSAGLKDLNRYETFGDL